MAEAQNVRLSHIVEVLAGQSPLTGSVTHDLSSLPFIQGCSEFGALNPLPRASCPKPPKIAPCGAVLLSVRAPVGRINVSNQRIGIGRGVAALIPNQSKVSSEYLHYALLESTWQLDVAATGSTFDAVSGYDIRSMTVPLWSPDDQELIVRYLDNAELRIATAIQAKLDLVSLLRERRTAIETEVLFGGAWSSFAQTWFGQGRVDWAVLPARALFDEVIERNTSGLPMLSVTINKGVIPQTEYMSSASSKKDQSRTDRSQYKGVRPGDIVYNKMRAWQGLAGTSEYRGIVSPAYVVLRPKTGVVATYFGSVMRTPQFAREAVRWSYGIASDMWSLRPQHFKTIRFLAPPTEVQKALVIELLCRTTEIDQAIGNESKQVFLLREYRTRLIADVVTGRNDVRADAATLPNVDPFELARALSGTSSVDDDVDEEVSADAD